MRLLETPILDVPQNLTTVAAAVAAAAELGKEEIRGVQGGGGDGGVRLYGWLVECHGLWHNVLLMVPSVLFLIFLASQAKKSFSKITSGRSHVVIALYGFLWFVSLLNLVWCFLQAWECMPGKEASWNILSLLTTSGMLFLEVSLIAFLLQGNYASGQEAYSRTFVISGLVVGLDMFLKAIYIYGFRIPLFVINNSSSQWGLWVVHKLLLTGVYGFLFCMYRSRWRERLPARPAFYNYVTVMFCLNVLAFFACALAAHGVGFGLWLHNVAIICYHAFYLPLLYVTFLADFFQEDDLNLENVYYSEMKDAGFFDADWE